MSLYDEDLASKITSFLEKAKLPIIGLVILIVVILIAVNIPFLIPEKKMMELSFEKNPIKENESTLLKINLINNLDKDIQPIIVNAKAIDEKSIIVFPENLEVPLLGKNEQKQLEFSILPKQGILKGDYSIEVEVLFNDQKLIERTILKVE